VSDLKKDNINLNWITDRSIHFKWQKCVQQWHDPFWGNFLTLNIQILYNLSKNNMVTLKLWVLK